MSWYRTGTVAVTNGSKTVTGVGTLWTTAVNAGDAFALVDANLNPTGAWYEVESVASNTSLTLKQSYAGTTGSNNQYCVFNMVGNMTTPSFAQRLATFFASFQSLIDKPTATPTAASIPIADANGTIDLGWLPGSLAICNTGASTAAKVATLAGFVLRTGATIMVKFAYTNTANTPTLAVNGTPAKPIKNKGAAYKSLIAGRVYSMSYDGASWEISIEPDASETAKGVVELATSAEVLAGTDDERAVSPASLKSIVDVEGGLASTDYADGKITQTITEGVEDKAPSEGAVFDALALKAPLASPTFTGAVVVPDQTAGDNSTKAANTKYVDAGLALKADITYVEYLMMEGDPA